MKIDPAFWNGKRVFVTGHTGFKGTWLSLWLQSMGCEVTGYALPPETDPNLFEMAGVAAGMNSITGNVQDLAPLRTALSGAQPDIVLHLAAQALVRYSYDHPIETYATNVMGTVNLLEACRTVPSVRSVVIVTSDKCYENREWERGYVETDAMGGHDPYSSSKGCSELVTSAYRNSFFSGCDTACAVASGRAGNVIGGGDWALDRIVPDTLMAFMRGEAASIRNPNAVRPWQHVLEPLHGYLLLAERLFKEGRTFAEGWNFGPSEESSVPVGTMVQKMEELWGDSVRAEIQVDPDAVHEATLLRLDCSKAAGKLDWHPKLDLDETLQWTVEWYRKLHEGADMTAFTMEQIKHYGEL